MTACNTQAPDDFARLLGLAYSHEPPPAMQFARQLAISITDNVHLLTTEEIEGLIEFIREWHRDPTSIRNWIETHQLTDPTP